MPWNAPTPGARPAPRCVPPRWSRRCWSAAASRSRWTGGGSTHALTASLRARDGHALGHLRDGDRRLCPTAVELQAGLLYRVLRVRVPGARAGGRPGPDPPVPATGVDAPWATVPLTAAEFAPLLYSRRFELLVTDADGGRLAGGPR